MAASRKVKIFNRFMAWFCVGNVALNACNLAFNNPDHPVQIWILLFCCLSLAGFWFDQIRRESQD